MKLLWINGWGHSERALLRQVSCWRPDLSHQVVQPFADWRENLAAHLGEETRVCGYSLGAFLLGTVQNLLPLGNKGVLCAPYFPAQGRADESRTQTAWLRAMRTEVAREPEAVLRSFARFVAISPDDLLPVLGVDDLCWGLSAMLELTPVPHEMAGYRVVAGAQDPLPCVEQARAIVPHLELDLESGHQLSRVLASVDFR